MPPARWTLSPNLRTTSALSDDSSPTAPQCAISTTSDVVFPVQTMLGEACFDLRISRRRFRSDPICSDPIRSVPIRPDPFRSGVATPPSVRRSREICMSCTSHVHGPRSSVPFCTLEPPPPCAETKSQV